MGDTHSMSVPLNLTPDGFMSQECPECERRFKVAPGKGSPDPVTHCPYCNYEGENCWWTKEQAEYIGAYSANKILGPQIDKMAREFNRGGSGIMSMSVKRPTVPSPPIEEDDMLATFAFECCGETIRHDGNSTQMYCPICGTTTNV